MKDEKSELDVLGKYIGKTIVGFDFSKSSKLPWNPVMKELVGEKGIITEACSATYFNNGYFSVTFKKKVENRFRWSYPIDLVIDQLESKELETKTEEEISIKIHSLVCKIVMS